MLSLRQAVQRHLPTQAVVLLRKILSLMNYLRVQASVTAVLGPQYRRSRTRLEIDLTWSCNLRCFNCNRSCEQAPTGERMEPKQIRHFIDQSIATGQQWKQIRLLGGEPTLHPEFSEIVHMLLAWREKHSPNTRLEVVTNGYGCKVEGALARLPPGIEVHNTSKVSQTQPFRSFNVAPVDCAEYDQADYTNGCRVIKVSGIGLTPYGWYPCAIAGGIDRIVGFDLGRKHLPDPEDDMLDQLKIFCRLCGNFKRRYEPPVYRPVKSQTWEWIYNRHREEPPKLTKRD